MNCNKVFGIGLSRTGSQSLASALNQAGVTTIHFPRDIRTFEQLVNGDFNLDILTSVAGVCDTPVVPYFAQLDFYFPGSKFILTMRDIDSWLASCERLWKINAEEQTLPYYRFVNASVYGVWNFSRERFAYVYERHLRDVRTYFADRPDDLLQINIIERFDWDPLCSFLGLSIPDAPFPHVDFLAGR